MIAAAEELTGVRFGRDRRADSGLRVLADHGRGMTFLIADGVLPSNEDRGYVLRRIMRRAVRHARLLGSETPVLAGLAEATVAHMGDFYPELLEKKDFVLEVASREEERFSATLRQGLTLLESELARAKEAGAETLPGDVAFRLHDTFGFPVDLTNEIAAETGLGVDQVGFESLMAQQRERARQARRGEEEKPAAGVLAPLLEERGPTEFLGYEHLAGEGKVLGISDGAHNRPSASEGEHVDVVLDATVFYPEGGGQVGDRGVIRGPNGEARVTDTQRLLADLIALKAEVLKGEIAVGDAVRQEVDATFRHGCEQAHTATHIVHWILRDRLGEHARQAGSLVEPGRLRFDFNHFEALNPGHIAEISAELQDRVLVDDSVRAYETSYDYARSIGAMAIFGEKYGDFVRVVEVGDYSKELCGGTHVRHTSRIGVAVITSEGSIGSNLRRVEALVGREGLAFLRRRSEVLSRAAELLRANPDEVAERLERLLTTQKEMERKLNEVERRSAESEAESLAAAAQSLDGVRLVVARRDEPVDRLRSLAQTLKGRLGSAVVIFGTAGEGRANLVTAVTRDVVDRGLSAREMISAGAQLLGGGGGGKPDLAISGGPRADNIDAAIHAVERAAREALTT
jgi:alanyl-tRNA synthetase